MPPYVQRKQKTSNKRDQVDIVYDIHKIARALRGPVKFALRLLVRSRKDEKEVVVLVHI